jgi:hypothetical protein
MGPGTLPGLSPEANPMPASPIETAPVGAETNELEAVELVPGPPEFAPLELGPLETTPLEAGLPEFWTQVAPFKLVAAKLDGSAHGMAPVLESVAAGAVKAGAGAAAADGKVFGEGLSCRTPNSERLRGAGGNGIEFTAAGTKP